MRRNTVEQLEAMIDAYEALIQAATQSYIDGEMAREDWLSLTTAWFNKKRRLERRLEKLKAQRENPRRT